MKLIPLIGSLIISAAPVQAFETFGELDKACSASEEMDNMCAGAAEYGSTAMAVSLLCDLEEKGRITKENLDLTWDEVVSLYGWAPLPDEAVEMALKDYPECSLNP